MQGSWPDFRALVLSVTPNAELLSHPSSARTGPSGGSNANPGPGPVSGSASSTSSRLSSFSEVTLLSTSSAFNPMPGTSAIGSGIAAVLHAAGGFLRLLRHGDVDGGSKRRKGKKERVSKSHDLKMVKHSPNALGHGGDMIFISTNRGTASFLLSRFTSLLKGRWGRVKNSGALPAMMAAILPPLEAPSLIMTPECGHDFFGEAMSGEESGGAQGCNTQLKVVEPKTGVQFPMHLSGIDVDDQAGNASHSCQVLVGVGSRSKEIIKFKSIKIYAFGLYVQPEHLRAQLGDKYKGVPHEELKDRPNFLDDLLRSHEVDMTVRLVVHFKGLKMGMVRNAFQEALRNRLQKIEGGAGDEGLQTFCSYLSDDIRLYQGSTIDIRWQPGGRLRTEIGGRQVGVIHSPPLCQAFFDMYIGDPPVSVVAKQTIGANFARILQERSS